MVYIKDILIRQQPLDQSYLSVSEIKYSDWSQKEKYIRFKVCDENYYFGKYIFDKMFHPYKEFDDEEFVY